MNGTWMSGTRMNGTRMSEVPLILDRVQGHPETNHTMCLCIIKECRRVNSALKLRMVQGINCHNVMLCCESKCLVHNFRHLCLLNQFIRKTVVCEIKL